MQQCYLIAALHLDHLRYGNELKFDRLSFISGGGAGRDGRAPIGMGGTHGSI